jgi:uncharacterized damage-inducible protein DinB
MQVETARIKKLLDRNWTGPMWHGGTLGEILKDISWEKAFAKPQGATHNIYEYVRHMTIWRHFTIEQMNGHSDYKLEINSEEDWPTTYEVSEANWLHALSDLEANQSALVSGMDSITDEQLDELVPGRKFKWYALLHGIIHHDIYHSAQISLLKNQK